MNELSTLVPGAASKVKGIDKMLTQEDVAAIISRPVRWVREQLLSTGVLKSTKFGAREYRIRPIDLTDLVARGNAGFRSTKPSKRVV